VTGRAPELFFLRIVTPSVLEFGCPVNEGSIGYNVAEGMVGLAAPVDGAMAHPERCEA